MALVPEGNLDLSDLPPCPDCGGPSRPDFIERVAIDGTMYEELATVRCVDLDRALDDPDDLDDSARAVLVAHGLDPSS